MAYNVDVATLNPAILRGLARSARSLTPKEQTALRNELSQDPKKVGYKTDGDGEMKPAFEVAGLMNVSGRTETLFGAVIIDAGDIFEANSAAQATEAAPEAPVQEG